LIGVTTLVYCEFQVLVIDKQKPFKYTTAACVYRSHRDNGYRAKSLRHSTKMEGSMVGYCLRNKL